MITRVNYNPIIKYAEKNKLRIESWIDTLVYMDYLKLDHFTLINSFIAKYTLNTNVKYLDFSNWLKWYVTFAQSDQFLYATLHLFNDEYSFPACQFTICQKEHYVKSTFYWLFFRFCKLYNTDYELIKKDLNIFDLPFSRIARCDYAIDIIWMTVNKGLELLKKNKINAEKWLVRKNLKQIQYFEWNNIQTHYIWNKKSKYAYVRLYDKTLDNKDKKKSNFYFDYDKQTLRIEWQFMTTFTSEHSILTILEKIKTRFWIANLYHWNFYEWKRYDKDKIANIHLTAQRWCNLTIKLAHNWYDLKNACEFINLNNDIIHLRVRKKQFSNT